MKRMLKVILIILLLILSTNVNALSGSIEITCSKTTIYINESTSCIIKGIMIK